MTVIWTDNPIMFWNDAGTWKKVPDHGRQGLDVSNEFVGTETRMADGTLRRFKVAIKRSWETSWNNLPAKVIAGGMTVAGGGMTGSEIETFYRNTPSAFSMRIMAGDGTMETVTVMITDFSKEVVKRSEKTDLWNVSVTLKEV